MNTATLPDRPTAASASAFHHRSAEGGAHAAPAAEKKITTGEAAAILDVSNSTVLWYVRTGQLRGFQHRRGAMVRVLLGEVEAMANREYVA